MCASHSFGICWYMKLYPRWRKVHGPSCPVWKDTTAHSCSASSCFPFSFHLSCLIFWLTGFISTANLCLLYDSTGHFCGWQTPKWSAFFPTQIGIVCWHDRNWLTSRFYAVPLLKFRQPHLTRHEMSNLRKNCTGWQVHKYIASSLVSGRRLRWT